MSISEELQRLEQLRQDGTLSEAEFQTAKADVLERDTSAGGSGLGSSLKPNQWAMFLHLSQLANFAIPAAGIILPILIWQLKKEEYPILDAHGKNAANWMLSAFIYSIICVVLMFVFVGILLGALLGILAVVFPIIAALKANDGEVWDYPLTIRFLS